jgi:hypothetical protein
MRATLIGVITLATGLLLLCGACVEYYGHLGLRFAGEGGMPWGLLICLGIGATLLDVSGAVLLLEKR